MTRSGAQNRLVYLGGLILRMASSISSADLERFVRRPRSWSETWRTHLRGRVNPRRPQHEVRCRPLCVRQANMAALQLFGRHHVPGVASFAAVERLSGNNGYEMP